MEAPLFVPSLMLLGGVVLSYFLEVEVLFPMLGFLLVIGIGEWRRVWSSRWRWMGMVLVFGFAYGIWRREVRDDLSLPRPYRGVGVISGEVTRVGRMQRFEFEGNEGDEKKSRKWEVMTSDPREFEWGDRLEIRGRASDFETPRNPGGFDEKTWRERMGYSGRVWGEGIEKIPEREGCFDFSLGHWFLENRQSAERFLSAGGMMRVDEEALIQGMILGDVSGMSRVLKDEFRSTGTGHIFAVSGQNLGVILIVIVAGMRLLGINAWRWGWISIGFFFYYAGLTGFQSSCLRALTMITLLLIAWRIDRPSAWLNFWAATLLSVLLWSPNAVEDLGYQLSFLVVVMLILGTSRGMEWMKLWWNWDWDCFLSRSYATPVQVRGAMWRKSFCSLLVGSVIAFFAVLPHAVFVFHGFNLISILLNLLVVPLAGVVVGLGVGSLIVGFLHPFFSMVMNFPLMLLARGLLLIIHIASGWSWFAFPVADFRTWGWSDSPEFLLLDAGEVPQAIVRYHGESWLVNCGSLSNYERILRPALKYEGISHLEGIFVCTVSESSNGALKRVLEEYSVSRVVRPEDRSRSPLEKRWESMVDRSKVLNWRGGDCYSWGQAFGVAYLKSVDEDKVEGMNGVEDQGLILDFNFQGRSIIWANRIGGERESRLTGDRSSRPPVSVLIEGESPKSKNLSREWLDYLSPEHLILLRARRSSHRAIDDLTTGCNDRTMPSLHFLDRTGALSLKWSERGVKVERVMR